MTSKNLGVVAGVGLAGAGRSVAKRAARRALARAARAVVENLEGRTLMAGDASVIQALPFALDFESDAGGMADKDGMGTGFTWVQPNKNNNEYQPSLIDATGGRLRITTTGTALAGGPWENDNTLVNALQTQFNASTGSFAVTTRMVGPFGYLDQASEQGGLLFGPDQDNYVKLVLVAQPNGRFLQFIDEQKPSTTFVHQIASANSYTNVGSFGSINTIDLTIAGDAATGKLTAFYRINGGTQQQVTQSLTLSGSQKTKFFSAAARAGVMAMQKNDLAAETLAFESFAINPGTPQVARPSVRADQINPAPGQTDVKRDTFVSASVNLPNVGKGVDTATLNTSTVKLYRTSDKVAVPGHVSTSGAGDTLTFQPYNPFDANTQYTFEVTAGVKDTSGAQFVPFSMTFTTGTRITPTDPNLAFQKVELPTATGQLYSGVAMGPDGKLYASTLTGLIQRWSVNPDGTLGAAENITTVQTANGGNRFITGFAFDPASTANNPILWVNNAQYAFEGASDWTGKLSRLSGTNLQNYQDYVVGLPRAIRDHLNNQPVFGPGGKLYFNMGSTSAMGAADNAWGLRPERLLTAAVLQVDTDALLARVAAGQGPLNVRTEGTATNYDPWAANAPVKLYATGVRNAYDLVYTRDGKLYAPTNGSAAGGATPSAPAGTFGGTRIDSGTSGPYTTPAITGIPNVSVSEPDFLFKIDPGAYYGHPNPTRGEFVLNGGNPTDGVDYQEFSQYPVGTQPDRNYRGATYTFGQHYSPNGAIEYVGGAFGGRLDGKILVTRYAGGADVVALSRDADGNITEAQAGISGLTGFTNPLDITQDLNTGSLYIADYGAQRIYLARVVTPGARIAVDKPTLRFNDDYASSNTTPSGSQVVRIQNTGTQPLSIPNTGLVLSNTANWVITKQPNLPTTVAPGEFVEVAIAFRATSASGSGLRTATLTITSNDSTNPTLVVNLRGLAMPGTGGMNEPSLQRILDLYQIPVQTGDANPGNTNLFSNTEPLNGTNDEVLAQRFVKAGAGPVTIEPLASFAGGTPASKFGYYRAGTADSRTELVWVSQADAQSVNPALNGTTSFDPGTGRFGLYAYFPIFDNYAYSEDSLNTKENTAGLRRKFRFYPLKDANGATVPNAYIFTNEDFNNDPNGATDSNDFVGIIRNVTPANDGPELGLENRDGVPFADRLAFNRVQIMPGTKTDPNTGEVVQIPPNVVHDTAVLRVRNTGSAAMTLNSLAVNSTSVWQIVDPPAAGTQVPAGGFIDITVKFVATVKPPYPGFNTTPDPTGQAAYRSGFYNGTLTIGTDDADEPTTTVKLAGWFQEESEKNQEPSLPVLVNNIFGYTTKILNSGQSLFTDGGNGTTVLGDEVLSKYWVRADGSAPVGVRQLAAYHTQGNTAIVRWAPYNNPGSLAGIFVHDGEDGQSVLPRIDGGAGPAAGSFKPYSASNNLLSAFQFKIDMEWSDDAMNKPVETNPNDTGHHVRFWPAKDQAGNVIPNTWLMGMDYLGINYDYQDNLYLVTNMKPMPPSTPTGVAAASAPTGVAIDWADVTGFPLLTGYNVYRSTTANGTFTKLNGGPVTGSEYTDTSTLTGVTYYYRVTAVDNWGGESGTSAVVSGLQATDNQPPAPPSGLAGVGVNNGIRLTWAALTDADLAGYRVYRSDSAGGTYTLLNTTLLTQPAFTDSSAANGSTWFYKVTGVDFSGNESGQSDAATATAGDVTAPVAPSNLAAASVATGIQLTWSAPADSDVAGYRVYRSDSAGGTYTLVSGGSLLTSAGWTDTTAVVGETWFYAVTAVDLVGNESAQSVPASATRTPMTLPTIRINLGGGAFTDSAGTVWQADQYFTGGTATTSNHDVLGTTDDPLYLARRYGAYTYAIPAANGSYTLRLHFSDPSMTAAGQRKFSVKVEGLTILDSFDIIAAAGAGKTRLVKTFAVTITDGVLNLQTIKILDNPIISAIELIPNDGQVDATPPAAPTAVAATPATKGINLTWAANAEPDLAGYHVYRSASAGGPWTRLTTAPVTTAAYAHTSAPEAKTSYYRITAVDTAGNESDPSAVASALAPVVADGTGLVGRYYKGTAFNTLALTRTDGTVNFDWGTGSPNAAVGADNFSVRWTGKIKAAVTGSYTFTVRASDGVRLWVNGVQVINNWNVSGTTDKVSTSIALTAGQKYDIKLEYFESTGSASAKMYWEAAGLTKAIVPKGHLYTA